MRGSWDFLPCLIIVLILSGCASFKAYPDRTVDLTAELQGIDKYVKPEIINEYANANLEDKEKKKRLRDEVVNARVYAIDLYFGKFQQDLFGEGVGFGIATDWITLALAGAGAVTGNAGTKAALAAAAAGIIGAKAAFDKNVFFDKTMPALLAQMVALRKTVLARIQAGLSQGIDRYPLPQALIDLEDYYNAGTIPGAITGIVEGAGAAAKQADEEMKQVLVGRFTADAAGDALRRFWKPDGKIVNQENQARIRKWMDDNHVNELSITFFMRDESYAVARQKLVKDLGLQ
jgi:hypothetical protein